MLSVVKLLGTPEFKVKRSFLGVFELKMLQIFFSSFFEFSCWTCLKFRLAKVDKGLLRDMGNLYDHFKSYMFWCSKQKH